MAKASFHDLINGEKAILIDFHATWCGPCKSLAPILKDVASEIKDKVRVIKIDIDKNQSLATKLQVRGVPTLILYKAGEQLWRQSGVMSKHQLLSAIDPLVS